LWVTRRAVAGTPVPMVADADPSRHDLLLRVEQVRAQSQALREQVARLAGAVAQVELDVARVHEGIAMQGGSLAAQAREHAEQAREFAAREHAEAVRLRRVGRARSVGLREAARPRGRGSWPLACQIQRALAPCTSEGQQIVKDGRKAAGEGGWECLSTRTICHASTAVMLVLVSAVAAHLLPSTLPPWASGHAGVLSAGAGRSRTRSALRLLVTRVRSRVWQRGAPTWLPVSGVSCLRGRHRGFLGRSLGVHPVATRESAHG
jgi:hypothetical protein